MPDVDGVGRVRKTHCKFGHKFDDDCKWATDWKGYKCRVCRECMRGRMRRKRENPDFKRLEAEKAARWRKSHPEENRAAWKKVHEHKKQILLDARKGGRVQCGETH